VAEMGSKMWRGEDWKENMTRWRRWRGRYMETPEDVERGRCIEEEYEEEEMKWSIWRSEWGRKTRRGDGREDMGILK